MLRDYSIAGVLAVTDHIRRLVASVLPIRRQFLSDGFDKLFAAAVRQGGMLGLCIGVAIFTACLGLFGLAAFRAERRTREKVSGARAGDALRLLLWQFSIPVLIVNLIAWPIAWYYLHDWVEGYADRITSGASALIIACAGIIDHGLAVARANSMCAFGYE